MKRASLYLAAALVFVLLIGSAFFGGIAFAEAYDVHALFAGIPAPESGLGKRVEEVRRLLDREALRPSSDESMTAGAVSGLLEATGDPYAMYFDPEQFAYFNEQSDGRFYGIGVTIAEREGVVYVVDVMEGTPAETAGLATGDEFLEIDGIARENWTVDEVVKRVRGPEGTTVELRMSRPDAESDAEDADAEDADAEAKAVDFTVERARIDIPNIMSDLVGDVGHIRLLNFNARSADELRDAIDELEGEGARGFVVDVRNNPGGLLQSAVDVASLFVADGVIVRVEERTGPEEIYRASGGTATDAPVVLLMNGDSASASEVLAGALRDHGRARLVGEQSFGKGSVQTVERLSFGGGVKYTVAHYLTPKGTAINGVGLAPDIEVEMDPELQRDSETDTQLKRAIEEVRSRF